MLRSLYSGVSGMRNNQTKMDVIGNNIANVNTTGFKSGRVRFQDMLSQTIANAQAPTDNNLGGVNPQQIGLGVQVGAIDTIMTGGALQPTNRDLDFAIEG
ncbi:MAG TPA: flagellar basal body rod protein FlgG, partial [Eubacteriaceae bacterium]|nr:flagellar basal body rod protein FlgG [Eubacteriaceae bacterium]